jgi:hypothetical protein
MGTETVEEANDAVRPPERHEFFAQGLHRNGITVWLGQLLR